MSNVGKSVPRVDAFDKATGRAKYTDDLCDKNALIIVVVRSTIAHGTVKSIDVTDAKKIPGVVEIFTCFDVPDIKFPTAGHPWSTEPGHQDVADRRLLNRHVRYYGDDVAAVVAENEVAANQAARAVKVEYDVLPFVLDPMEAMKDGAPLIHKEFANNILKHTSINTGNYDEAIKEPGLICVDKWYETQTVQHCHIENFIAYAYEEGGKIVVVSSTQIPHIVRRTVGQALGVPWGKVRIIKPYIGGGFGNKQDTLYEPLAAYVSTKLGGRLVKIDIPREDTFSSNRVRHAIRSRIVSWVRPDGTYVARKLECYSDQGAYASHGHSIAAKGMGAFPQMYPCPNVQCDAYTVYTNKTTAGAMRGYGIPQAMFAVESHTDDVCRVLQLDPESFRRKNLMPVGFKDNFSKNENYFNSYNECLDKAMTFMDYRKKMEEYKNQTGPVRKGLGISCLWYNTGVWPISLEHSSCRMVLHEDGSVQLQMGETEIGQGADTAFAQMAADVIGIRDYRDIHVVSNQDTDITPYGLGAYASRQTYVCSFSITEAGTQLKQKILKHASELTRVTVTDLNVTDSNIIRITDGKVLMSLAELATEVIYSLAHSEHITAESSYHIKNNAYSFGCCIAEVEVDIPMCKATVVKIVNVHDCGRLINPALAAAQVHGGMSMGIGYGLSEQLLFDPKTGKALNNNLLDYKLATAMDHPRLEAQFVENFEPTSPFGTKALGEPPATPVAPAIRNAILNATGVAMDSLPINPHMLFRRFSEEGLIHDSWREEEK
jgi:xanthine dehydrogenase molybdenum-binding subunit